MTGLIRNNFYVELANMRIFGLTVVVLGVVFCVLVPSQIGLYTFAIVSILGFSRLSISGSYAERASKWCKYKLTAPVRRIDIVKSYFLSHVIWLMIGLFLAVAGIGISILLHGNHFDKNADLFAILAVGASLSLLSCGIYFPLSFSGNGEKDAVFYTLSFLAAGAILAGMIFLVNWLYGGAMTEAEQMLATAVLLAISATFFIGSIPVTATIFKKKDF